MIGFLLFLFFAGILAGAMVILYFLFSPEEKQKRELHKKWMLENAIVIEVQFTRIEPSANEDNTMYRLVCVGDDLQGGEKTYYSQWMAGNPQPFMAPYKTFALRVNPHNSDHYLFTIPWQLQQFVKR